MLTRTVPRERGQAQIELPAGLFRQLLDVAPDAMVIADASGHVVLVNAQVEALFGWRREELVGQPVEVLIPERLRTAHTVHRAGYAAMPKPRSMGVGLALNGRRRDGSEFPVDVSLSPLSYHGHQLVIAAVRDISDRQRAEAALRASQADYKALVDTLNGIVWEADAVTLAFSFVSEQAERLLGYPREAWYGGPGAWVEHLHPEDRDYAVNFCKTETAAGRDHVFEYRMVAADGRVVWLQDRVTVILEDGRAKRLRGVMVDVTERKRAEQSFRELLEAAPDAMVMVDGSGAIQLINNQAERMFGRKRSELLGRAVETLIPMRFHSQHERHRTEYFSAPRTRSMGAGLELYGLRSDGTEFPVEVSLSPVTTESGIVSMAAIRDITERKRVDQARSLLAAIVENSEDAIITKTLDGVITSWNRGAERLFGYTASEMVGQPVDRLIPPEHRDEEAAIAARLRAGETLAHYESSRQARDGRILDVSLRISPLRDARGAIVGASKIARDITERRQAERELERRAEALTRSNEELEQFAYVASHDLQEPLRTVASYTQLLERRQAERADVRLTEYARYITEGVRQMQVLIDDLLAYSRVSRRGQDLEAVDLNAVMRTVLATLAGAVKESGGEVSVEPLPTVQGHPAQLVQLLQNLVANALKYRSDAAPRVHVTCARHAEGWQVSVSDNGIGIDPAHFDRIFVIFQRLHSRERYAGTGIGLALCRKIVTLYGGRIWVESAGPGHGSTFRFTLPEHPPEG